MNYNRPIQRIGEYKENDKNKEIASAAILFIIFVVAFFGVVLMAGYNG